MSSISISTVQNIDVEYTLASLGHRILAAIIDSAIIFAYIIVVIFLFLYLNNGMESRSDYTFLLLFIPAIFYHLLCELLMNGQSVGKKAMKIKVISLNGAQPSFSQYLLRWIFRLIDISISQGAVAVIAIAVNNKSQRLGDMVANTVVVSTNPKGRFGHTIYMPLIENYDIQYPEVVQLSSQDMQLIKEVVMMQSNNTQEAYNIAVETSDKIEKILNIRRKHGTIEFLQTLLVDYNHSV